MRSWENIMAHLDKYEHLDTKGGLQVFPPSKREFQWKNNPEGSLKDLLSLQIDGYYKETSHPERVEDGAREWFDRFIQPHYETALQELDQLVQAISLSHSKRIPKQIRKIQQLLSDCEADFRKDLIPYYQKMIGSVYEMHGDLGKEGAEARLRICLYEVLSTFTNLTKENKLEHIARLLHHFEIIGDDALDGAPDAIRQTVLNRKRSVKQKEMIEKSQIAESMNRLADYDMGKGPENG